MTNMKELLLNYVLLVANQIFDQRYRSIIRAVGNFQEFDVISKKF